MIETYSKELRLLIAVLGENEFDGVEDDLKSIDWNVFRKLSFNHRVDGIVAKKVLKFSGAPDYIANYYKVRLKKIAMQNLGFERAAKNLVRILEGASIDVMLLKGPSVGHRYYNQSVPRQYKDLDFWIDDKDLQKVINVLTAEGYRQDYPLFEIPEHCIGAYKSMFHDITFTKAGDRTPIELHWRLDQYRFMDWELADLKPCATQIEMHGSSIQVMDTASLFVFLCAHGMKHSWFRLRWIMDIRQMLISMDEDTKDQIIRRIEETQTQRMVGTSLALAHRLFPGILDELWAEFANRHCHKFCLKFCLKSIIHDDSRTSIGFADGLFVFRTIAFRWLLKQNWKYKASILYTTLVDHRDINRLRLSEKWLPVYILAGPIILPFRLLKRLLYK